MSTTGISPNCIKCGMSLINGGCTWRNGAPTCWSCTEKESRQPRFDWEAEEQRMDDLEDLVLQLVDRIERLEFAVQELKRPYYEKPQTVVPGQQIAKAIKAME